MNGGESMRRANEGNAAAFSPIFQQQQQNPPINCNTSYMGNQAFTHCN